LFFCHFIRGPSPFSGKDSIINIVFLRKGGRAPYEMTEEQLQMMGRLLARLHNVGANRGPNIDFTSPLKALVKKI
jgi:hypothetical protein